jgi:hypothetical protein
MSDIHREHKKSGYITAVKYQPTTDEEGKSDWLMVYIPGPKAHAEFAAAHHGHKPATVQLQPDKAGERSRRRSGPRQRRLKLEPMRETVQATEPKITEAAASTPEIPVNPEFLSALVSRGIAESAARDLLSKLKPDQQILDQLEWGESQVRKNPDTYKNPAGFYIYLIRENVTVPASFETSRKQAAREAEARRRAEEERLQGEYDLYKRSEIERHITEHSHEFGSLKESYAAQFRERYGNDFPRGTIDSLAQTEARIEMGKKVSMLTFKEFVRAEKAIATQLAHQQTTGIDPNEPVAPATPAEAKDQDLNPDFDLQTPESPTEEISPKHDSETIL